MRVALRQFCVSLAIAVAFCPSPATAQAHASDDKDLAELQQYTLTMSKVTNFYESLADLGELAKSNPQLKNSLESDADKHEDLSDIQRRIAAHPEITAVLAKHGFTPHEFVLTEMTVIQAGFAMQRSRRAPTRQNSLTMRM